MRNAGIAMVTVGAVLGALVSGGGQAGAAEGVTTTAACLDQQRPFHKISGQIRVPDLPGYYQTTSSCKDINIRPDKSANVRVCFVGADCRSTLKYVPAGRWSVVATNVRDTSRFYFVFSNGTAFNGWWAA